MRPRAHQRALLILEMRKLDLEHAFAGMSTAAKDFENEAGAVENLGIPGALQIALLDRRKRGVDDDEIGLALLHDSGDLGDFARAEKSRRSWFGKRSDQFGDDFKIDRPRQLYCLGKAARRIAFRLPQSGTLFALDMDDDRPGRGPALDLESNPLTRAPAVSSHLPGPLLRKD